MSERSAHDATPVRTTPAVAHAPTDAELEALNYFVAGIGASGRPAGAGLWFPGGIDRNGGLAPADARGYTLGVLLTDLGADPHLAQALVEAYQTWAQAERPDRALNPRQAAQTAADLGRDAAGIRAEDGRVPNATVLAYIDGFLATAEGIAFAHAADRIRSERLMREVHAPLRALPLYRDATPEQAWALAAAFAITWLHNPQGVERLREDIGRGLHRDVAAVAAAATAETGSDPSAALETFRALQSAPAGSPLADAWRTVLDEPLALPTGPMPAVDRSDAMLQYAVVRELFLRSAQAPAFAASVAQGLAYGVGRYSEDGRHFRGHGLYAADGHFALWSEDGQGAAAVGGTWHAFDRERLQRMQQRGGGVDLVLERDEGHVLLLRIPGQASGTAGGTARGEDADILEANTFDAARSSQLASIDPHHLAIEKWSPEQQKVYENVRDKAQEMGLPKDRADMLAAHTVASWKENERLVPRVDHVHVSRSADGDTLVTLAYMQHGMKEPIFTHSASLNNSPAFEQSVAKMEQMNQRPTADQQKNRAQETARNEAHMRQVKDGERTPGQDNIQQVVEGVANPILRGRM